MVYRLLELPPRELGQSLIVVPQMLSPPFTCSSIETVSGKMNHITLFRIKVTKKLLHMIKLLLHIPQIISFTEEDMQLESLEVDKHNLHTGLLRLININNGGRHRKSRG